MRVLKRTSVAFEFSKKELTLLVQSLMRSDKIGAGDLMDDILDKLDEVDADLRYDLDEARDMYEGLTEVTV